MISNLSGVIEANPLVQRVRQHANLSTLFHSTMRRQVQDAGAIHRMADGIAATVLPMDEIHSEVLADELPQAVETTQSDFPLAQPGCARSTPLILYGQAEAGSLLEKTQIPSAAVPADPIPAAGGDLPLGKYIPRPTFQTPYHPTPLQAAPQSITALPLSTPHLSGQAAKPPIQRKQAAMDSAQPVTAAAVSEEPPSAVRQVAKPRLSKPGSQVSYPAMVEAPGTAPAPVGEVGAAHMATQPEPQSSEADWKRLTAIYRRHHELGDLSNPVSAHPQTEPSAQHSMQRTVQRKASDVNDITSAHPEINARQDTRLKQVITEMPVQRPRPQTDQPGLKVPTTRRRQAQPVHSEQLIQNLEEPIGADLQSAPLQEVWPVQLNPMADQEAKLPPQAPSHQVRERLWNSDPTASDSPVQRSVVEPRSNRQGVDPYSGKADFSQTQAVLQSIPPGQPSDSEIELIPPRLLRPPSAAVSPGEVSTPKLSAEHHLGGKMGRDVPEKLGEPGGADTVAAPIPNTKRPSPAPLEKQARPQKAATAIQTKAASDAVPTIIGPLPGDLWNLIGEPVPGAGLIDEPASAPQAAPKAGGAGGAALLKSTGRKKLPAAAPGYAGNQEPAPIYHAEAAQPVQRAVIQRQSEETPPTQPAAPSAAEEAQDPPAAGSQPVNVEELSRKVYAEIKRKLAHEKERFHR